MRPALQTLLVCTYPRIFRHSPAGTKRYPWRRGTRSEVECGDGWFTIIDRLSRACENEIRVLMAQGVPKEGWPRIAQIKEKFGGLRFYVHGPLSDDLRAQILQAENEESFCICERCGAPGKLRESQWRKTYCDDCDV